MMRKTFCAAALVPFLLLGACSDGADPEETTSTGGSSDSDTAGTGTEQSGGSRGQEDNTGSPGTGGSDSAGGSESTGGKASGGRDQGTGASDSAGGSESTGGKASGGRDQGTGASDNTGGDESTGGSDGSGDEDPNPLTNPEDGPPAGNPDGNCDVPAEARLEDVSTPDRVIGDGTPESCTENPGDVVSAVAEGGVITFDCGPDPVTITLEETAKVFNDTGPIVIDGGGKVTLSGGGQGRILYMNTCDEAQHWTTEHCDNQDHPKLTVQNMTFIDGKSEGGDPDGGGAIVASGGQVKIINSRFFNNVCDPMGPDVGGGAVRILQHFADVPAYVVNTTFGGEAGFGNEGSNGGGLSTIHTDVVLINSLFTHNRAIGYRGNPADDGTEGGGSGGALYMDGLLLELTLCGTLMEYNTVRAYGSAIFFVSNDHLGILTIDDSVIRNNTGGEWNVLPSISMHDDTEQHISGSTIE